LSKIWHQVNKDKSVVRYTTGNWVQPNIQYLQLCVSMKTTQLIDAGNVVVISNNAMLSLFYWVIVCDIWVRPFGCYHFGATLWC